MKNLKNTFVRHPFGDRFHENESGVAVVEFAMVLPLLLTLGLGGLELANIVQTKSEVSQLAMQVADHSSRVGDGSVLDNVRIFEEDINDVLNGTETQGESIDFLENGRIILSSLQNNAQGGQWIAWQRCHGNGNFTPRYGAAGAGATGTGLAGMGPNNARIKAPQGEAVMFAEVYYKYKYLTPIYEELFGEPVFAERAAFVVRDDRDITSLVTPGTGARTC